MIYHIYKADCRKASRVVMQASWVEDNIYVHKTDSLHKSDIELKLWAIFRLIFSLNEQDHVIFHAQSSLPYHLFFLVISRIFLKNTNTVYDVHDLNECSPTSSVYSKFRFSIMHTLEFIVIRAFKVKVITVSHGISLLLEQRFRVSKPRLVYNCSIDMHTNLLRRSERQKSPVFFGTGERFPYQLLPLLRNNNLTLDFYGRGVSSELLSEYGLSSCESVVNFLGEYSPSDLNFVSSYIVSLNYSPENIGSNFKYSLPNKLFQSLYLGATVVVSENFEEMVELFSDIKYAVVKTSKQTFIKDLHDVIDYKTDSDALDARNRVLKLHELSKENFLAVTAAAQCS